MKSILIFTFLLLATGVRAQSVAELERLFDDPPNTCRRLPINHDLTEGDIEKQLRQLQYERAGGTVLNVPWGRDYLKNEDGWKNLQKALEGMKKRGQIAWIYDEITYPSGFAGGLTCENHPEFLPVLIAFDKTDAASLQDDWILPPGEPILVAAVKKVGQEIDLKTLVDLTPAVKDGKLYWAKRPGDWLLIAFIKQMQVYKGTHAEIVHHPYVNIMDPRAIRRFIEVTHDAYAKHVGDYFGNTITAFFTDEPSLMSGCLAGEEYQYPLLPWSDDFPVRFEKEHGYPLTRALPAVALDAGPDTHRYRCDFWNSVGKAVADAFFGQISNWCRAHGVLSSGHPLWEESLSFHVPFYGNLYECLKQMDMSGMDLLGSDPGHTHGAAIDGGPVTPKLISSVAHLMGHTRTMTESFCLTRDPDFEKVMGVVNWQIALGINSISTYTINDCFTNKQYRELNDHIGRLSALTTRGRHVCEVAVLYPISAAQAGFIPSRRHVKFREDSPETKALDDDYMAVCRTLIQTQHDYDLIDDDLLAKASVRKGRLEIADESFSMVVVPPMRVMRLASLKKLLDFARSGGQVIFVGRIPEKAVEWGKDDEFSRTVNILMDSKLAGRVWRVGSSDDKELIDAWRKIPSSLSSADFRPEILYLHRRMDLPELKKTSLKPAGGYDIFLIVNNAPETVREEFFFRANGTPKLWWPRTGKKEESPSFRRTSERSALDLSLPAYSCVFVVFDRP